LSTDRRVFGDDDEERYLILRATAGSNETNTGKYFFLFLFYQSISLNNLGVEVTLQNHAVMNTRLRVIYTDANGKPAMVETGRLWAGQTKSVKLPLGAQNINVIVEKDLFFESWRLAYKGTLTDEKQCIRITGVTLFSKIHSCK